MALNDDTYKKAAILFVNYYLGTNFPTEDPAPPEPPNPPLEPLIEVVVDMLIKGFKENPALASQTLGDMSKSFFDNRGFFDKAIAILDKVKGDIHGEDPSKGSGRVKFY